MKIGAKVKELRVQKGLTQEELADRLGVAVKIRHGSKGRGRLEIEYLDLDQLDRFLAALTRE